MDKQDRQWGKAVSERPHYAFPHSQPPMPLFLLVCGSCGQAREAGESSKQTSSQGGSSIPTPLVRRSLRPLDEQGWQRVSFIMRRLSPLLLFVQGSSRPTDEQDKRCGEWCPHHVSCWTGCGGGGCGGAGATEGLHHTMPPMAMGLLAMLLCKAILQLVSKISLKNRKQNHK